MGAVETYRVYAVRESGGERSHFMSGLSGRDLIVAAFRLRRDGLHPVAYVESGARDGARIWV